MGDSVKISLYIYQTILITKDELNDLSQVGDTHNYNTRKRGALAL